MAEILGYIDARSPHLTPLLEADPSLGPKVRTVPKGMGLQEEAPFSLRSVLSIPADRPLFLMPGGIRPVKGQLRAIGYSIE